MSKKILELVAKAEKEIDYILQDHKDPWNLNNASLWVMNADNKMVIQQQNPDVYDLLKSSQTLKIVKNNEFFTILTCGWAAPISEADDCVPSQSPNRRRVRLVVGANISGVASVLRFQDTPYETITDKGAARGTLADAVQKLVDKKKKHEIKKVTKEIQELIEG
jgi:hypothetical protein